MFEDYYLDLSDISWSTQQSGMSDLKCDAIRTGAIKGCEPVSCGRSLRCIMNMHWTYVPHQRRWQARSDVMHNVGHLCSWCGGVHAGGVLQDGSYVEAVSGLQALRVHEERRAMEASGDDSDEDDWLTL